MHVVCETMTLWFSKEYQVYYCVCALSVLTYSKDTTYYPWSLFHKIKEIDADLSSIQIPHGHEEPPRSLLALNKWKGISPISSFTYQHYYSS